MATSLCISDGAVLLLNKAGFVNSTPPACFPPAAGWLELITCSQVVKGTVAGRSFASFTFLLRAISLVFRLKATSEFVRESEIWYATLDLANKAYRAHATLNH